jgi:hypothetical protein
MTSKVKPLATQPSGTSNFFLGDRFLAGGAAAPTAIPVPSIAVSAIAVSAIAVSAIAATTSGGHVDVLGHPVGR